MAIDESAFTPSDSYGILSVAKNLIPLAAIYTLAPYLADVSLILAWALMPIVGLLIYRLTMVMHDCGHLTLFTTRARNAVAGRFLGFLTGVDFERFRDRHWEHHRNYGMPDDPQGFHYIGASRMSKFAFLWHLVKPVFGLNLKYVYSESLLSPQNFRRVVFSVDFLGFIAVQAVVLVLISGEGRHLSLIFLTPVAAVTFGLFFSQLRGMAEHGTRASVDTAQEGFVRSHRTDWLGALLLYDVHFNYHAEHHSYPGIPSCRLPAFSAHMKITESSNTTMWHTLSGMWTQV